MERLTDKHFNKLLGYYMKCSGCCERSIACNECEEFESLVDRLGAIEEILDDNYDLDRLRELVEADRDGRCVVFPAKTVFELTWDAGPDCDMICPITIDGEGQCDFCDKGKLFIYEQKCRQDHIDRLGKDVFLTCEAAKACAERRTVNEN